MNSKMTRMIALALVAVLIFAMVATILAALV